MCLLKLVMPDMHAMMAFMALGGDYADYEQSKEVPLGLRATLVPRLSRRLRPTGRRMRASSLPRIPPAPRLSPGALEREARAVATDTPPAHPPAPTQLVPDIMDIKAWLRSKGAYRSGEKFVK